MGGGRWQLVLLGDLAGFTHDGLMQAFIRGAVEPVFFEGGWLVGWLVGWLDKHNDKHRFLLHIHVTYPLGIKTNLYISM